MHIDFNASILKHTHYLNADVKYSRMRCVTVLSPVSECSIFSLSFFFPVEKKKLKMCAVLCENANGNHYVHCFGCSCDANGLHAKWCQHYRHVNKRYRLVNHFSIYGAVIVWHYFFCVCMLEIDLFGFVFGCKFAFCVKMFAVLESCRRTFHEVIIFPVEHGPFNVFSVCVCVSMCCSLVINPN